ncbi:hypothetical protein [Paludisphaera mucosa]|uniref:Uncharacterized protein n=1 Tax=Paludisphaera mucosa TaxID=3030827 RepID=A0ABT6F4Z6_9BACT|nr:hypothetical protein [Paludisphaera mucosa]MDG3002655.1 hypothetical protein [Paludisphaera mucosa]
MFSGSVSISQLMTFTALFALDFAVLLWAESTASAPVPLFLLAALNGVLVWILVLHRPLRRWIGAILAVGAVGAVVVATVIATPKPKSEWWIASIGATALAWAGLLFGAWHAGPRTPAGLEPDGTARSPFDRPSVWASILLGLAMTGIAVGSLLDDLGRLAAVWNGELARNVKTYIPRRIAADDPAFEWVFLAPTTGRTLKARPGAELIARPSASWTLGGVGRRIPPPTELTTAWALYDSTGPGLTARIAVDLVAMWPVLMLVGATLLILWIRPPSPPWRETFHRPGFWACCAPPLAVLPFVLFGGITSFRFTPLILSAAVGVAWLVQALRRRWRPEPTWIDRSGRALGCCWLGLAAPCAYAMWWGLIL